LISILVEIIAAIKYVLSTYTLELNIRDGTRGKISQRQLLDRGCISQQHNGVHGKYCGEPQSHRKEGYGCVLIITQQAISDVHNMVFHAAGRRLLSGQVRSCGGPIWISLIDHVLVTETWAGTLGGEWLLIQQSDMLPN